eukprot:COSAG02_NODE_118_length_35376_cov_20.294923_22_plen_110_part_00
MVLFPVVSPWILSSIRANTSSFGSPARCRWKWKLCFFRCRKLCRRFWDKNIEHFNAQAKKQMMNAAMSQAVYDTNKHGTLWTVRRIVGLKKEEKCAMMVLRVGVETVRV